MIDINKETEFLFDSDFFSDDFDSHENYEHLNRAEKLLSSATWKEIFNAWDSYKNQHCETESEMINFANLFVYYGGIDYPIPNPYKFIASIFSKIDINSCDDNTYDFLDGFAIKILEKCGLIDTVKDPYYKVCEDSKFKSELDKLKP